MHAFQALHLLFVLPTVAGVVSPVALRARARRPEVDAWQITTAWSLMGLVIGLAAVVAAALR